MLQCSGVKAGHGRPGDAGCCILFQDGGQFFTGWVFADQHFFTRHDHRQAAFFRFDPKVRFHCDQQLIVLRDADLQHAQVELAAVLFHQWREHFFIHRFAMGAVNCIEVKHLQRLAFLLVGRNRCRGNIKSSQQGCKNYQGQDESFLFGHGGKFTRFSQN